MDRETFIDQCVVRGMCSEEVAFIYTDQFPEDKEYTESDFIAAYRAEDKIWQENSGSHMRKRGNCPDD